MKYITISLAVFCIVPGSICAQTPSFDQSVDRAIAREQSLLQVVAGSQPVAETYIQELQPDSDFGVVPKTDHYFLGKVDFSKGVNTDSFLPHSKTHGFDVFMHLFSAQFLPRGFAQTMLIDGNGFDRAHYDFDFVRREFLGDVRTIVIDVAPRKGAGHGRFLGRIWVEDRDFNIVRFNGTYTAPPLGGEFLHFDSWRVNCGPGLWLPAQIYSEESSMAYAFHMRKLRFKSVTRLWGYTPAAERRPGEFTDVKIDLPSVDDHSDQAADNSPVESLRAWQRESEDNILDRMEKASLLAPRGDVDKVLETVVNNLVVTNQLNIMPEVRARVLLTSPLETFTVGHTIVISRGLIDTLPDEAALAAILAHELAHIALGHSIDTRFSFTDRVSFSDDAMLKNFRFVRSQSEEDAANEKAVALLEKSPYADKLTQAGLFLKAMSAESDRLPNLIKPLFGTRMAQGNNVLRMAGLLERAPELQKTRVDQIAAMPLGARTVVDPASGKLRMSRMRAVPPLSAREKIPFEITPIDLHLAYWQDPAQQPKPEVSQVTAQ